MKKIFSLFIVLASCVLTRGQIQISAPSGTGVVSIGGGSYGYHTSIFPASCTVNGVSYSTVGDCAFYSVLDAARTSGQNQTLIVDPGETDTCAGWDHPILPNSAAVSLVGAADYPGAWNYVSSTGTPVVQLKQTCNIGSTKAVITYESGSGDPTATVRGIYINANLNAGACGDFLRLSRSTIQQLACVGVVGSNRHAFQFGDSTHAFTTGWIYETQVEKLRAYTQTQIPFTQGGGTVTISGGAATGYSITAAGAAGSFTAPAASYQVIFTGWGVGVSQPNGPSPCTTVPTAHVTSLGGGQLTGIAFDTNGSGCDPAHTYFAVVPRAPMDEAYLFDNFSDGTASDLIAMGPVNIAHVEVGVNSAGSSYKNIHGYGGEPVMIRLDGSGNDVDAPNCDTPLQACTVNFGGGNYVHGGVRTHASYIQGAGDFWDKQNAKNKYGPISGCSDGAAGYSLFGSTTGPLNPRTGFSAQNLDIVDVDYCGPSAAYYPVTYVPHGFSSLTFGGTLSFGVSAVGIGQATCMATSGAGDMGAAPGYDPSSNLVTFQPNAYNNAGRIVCVGVNGDVVTRTIPTTGNSSQTFDIRTMFSAATPSATVTEQRSTVNDYANTKNYMSGAPVVTSVGPNNTTAGTMQLHTASANNSVNNYGINLDASGFVHLGSSKTFFETGGAFNDWGSTVTYGVIPGGYVMSDNNGAGFQLMTMGTSATTPLPIALFSYSNNYSTYFNAVNMNSAGFVSVGGGTAGGSGFDQGGYVYSPIIKATSGTRFVCVDVNGKLISSTTACSGT